jgi:hypothetical protein
MSQASTQSPPRSPAKELKRGRAVAPVAEKENYASDGSASESDPEEDEEFVPRAKKAGSVVKAKGRPPKEAVAVPPAKRAAQPILTKPLTDRNAKTVGDMPSSPAGSPGSAFTSTVLSSVSGPLVAGVVSPGPLLQLPVASRLSPGPVCGQVLLDSETKPK